VGSVAQCVGHRVHPLAHGKTVAARAQAHHRADTIPAGHMWKRERKHRLQQPGPDFPVRRVDACDLDAQQQLVRPRLRNGDGLEAHRLRTAVAVHHPGLHGLWNRIHRDINAKSAARGSPSLQPKG